MKTLCFIFILGKNLWHVVSFILCYILSLSSANSYVHWISHWIHLKLIIYDIMSNYIMVIRTGCVVFPQSAFEVNLSLSCILYLSGNFIHLLYTFSWFWVVWISKFQIFYEPLWMSIWVINEHFAVYMSSSTVCVNDWIMLLIMDDHGYVCWRFNVCV